MKRFGMAALAAALLLAAAHAAAQAYPAKPVRMVVPYPTGGGTDALARFVAHKLGERLGQPVVVENRTGASGNIGADFVAKSAPDGYTLLFTNDTIVISPAVSSVPYDVLRDLTPVGLVAESIIVVGVHPSVQATTLRELIALAKRQPGRLSYASCGNGTMMHLAAELLKASAEIDMSHVPYRGCGPAVQDIVSGQVPVFFNALNNMVKLEQQGRVRVLAVASSRRTTLAPNVPTVAEAGGLPGYETIPFLGMFAPARTPPAVIDRIWQDLRETVNSAEVNERIRALYFEPRPLSPQEMGAVVQSELARLGKVAKAAKITAD